MFMIQWTYTLQENLSLRQMRDAYIMAQQGDFVNFFVTNFNNSVKY
jgi:hypothetical protein